MTNDEYKNDVKGQINYVWIRVIVIIVYSVVDVILVLFVIKCLKNGYFMLAQHFYVQKKLCQFPST